MAIWAFVPRAPVGRTDSPAPLSFLFCRVSRKRNTDRQEKSRDDTL